MGRVFEIVVELVIRYDFGVLFTFVFILKCLNGL